MKRRILSSKLSDKVALENMIAELIDEAYQCGYRMTIDTEYQITMICVHKDKQDMPSISVNTVVEDKNSIEFNPIVNFPTIDTTNDGFYDRVESLVENEWKAVGRLCTHIKKFILHPNDYMSN